MATIADIGIPGLGTGILQPKLKNRWMVTFADLGGVGNRTDPLSLQVVTFNRPKLSFAEVELHRYNSVAWVAGKHTWDETSLTVEDDIGGSATRVLQEQLQQQQWLIGPEGPWLGTAPTGSIYKFVTYVNMLDGMEQVVETWTLEGCWLKSVDYAELDYSSSEQIKLSITMRFDHAKQSLCVPPSAYGTALGGGTTGNECSI
jgi:hypothetical protein